MFKKEKKHIFITCTPKSGSTYLLQFIASMLSYDIRIFIAAFDRTGQDVFEQKVIDSRKLNTVTHQHTRCSDHNTRILERNGIKPLLLTRNIYDSVISMRNHMYNEPQNSWWPMGYIDHNFYELNISEQYDFIIDHMIPWYINFYVSWKRYKKYDETLWLTYEEMMSNKLDCLQKIMDYYEVKYQVTEKIILKHEELIKGKTRKTDLSTIKERTELTKNQKNKIISLTAYYKDIDFSKIGL